MRRRLKPASVDGVIHNALRGMLRDAKAAGYRVVADELDDVISAAAGSRNPPGTLPSGGGDHEHRPDAEPVRDPTVIFPQVLPCQGKKTLVECMSLSFCTT